MWSQMTAELMVHVPPGSARSPSGVCLAGTWAQEVISPPQTVVSLEETCNHRQLLFFRKIWSPAFPLHCKSLCLSNMLFSIHLVLQGLEHQVSGEQGPKALGRSTVCLSNPSRLSWTDWNIAAAFPGTLKLYSCNVDEMGSPASPCLPLKSVVGEHMM